MQVSKNFNSILRAIHSFVEQFVFYLAFASAFLVWITFGSIYLSTATFLLVCILFWALPTIFKQKK